MTPGQPSRKARYSYADFIDPTFRRLGPRELRMIRPRAGARMISTTTNLIFRKGRWEAVNEGK